MKVTVTPAADDGYYCSGVSVNNGAVEVTEDPDGTYSFTIPSEYVTSGKAMTIHCAADGGDGEYTYSVYTKGTKDSAWVTRQNGKSNENVTVTFNEAGTQQICIKAEDSSGNIIKKYLTVTVIEDTLVNTSTVSSEQTTIAGTVTVKCAAAGGIGTYTYSVYTKGTNDSAWVTRQSKKTNRKLTLRFTDTGTQKICIKVVDGSGNIVKKYFTVEVDDCTLVNNSDISKSYLGIGESVDVYCAAEGGSGYYTYSVYTKGANDSAWTTVMSNSAETIINIPFNEAGSYEICVKAKDSDGSVVKSYFNVSVDGSC